MDVQLNFYVYNFKVRITPCWSLLLLSFLSNYSVFLADLWVFSLIFLFHFKYALSLTVCIAFMFVIILLLFQFFVPTITYFLFISVFTSFNFAGDCLQIKNIDFPLKAEFPSVILYCLRVCERKRKGRWDGGGKGETGDLVSYIIILKSKMVNVIWLLCLGQHRFEFEPLKNVSLKKYAIHERANSTRTINKLNLWSWKVSVPLLQILP